MGMQLTFTASNLEEKDQARFEYGRRGSSMLDRRRRFVVRGRHRGIRGEYMRDRLFAMLDAPGIDSHPTSQMSDES
jgi:hypothetical protein